MEKAVNILSRLTNYQNQQVILNYYQDDLLQDRDGFNTQTIKLENNQLIFIKQNGKNITINLKTYPKIQINPDFQNYYTLQNNTDRLEIYFP
ncbi:hypothetical protein ACWM35_17580 [Neobacillus sp. K501]